MKRFNDARHISHSLLPALAMLVAAGCTETAPPTAIEAREANQAAGTATAEVARTSVRETGKSDRTPGRNAGVVEKAQTAGAYSYLLVDVDGEDFWLATMATAVRAGQKIAWRDHAPMQNFKSQALGREFEQILFVDRIFTDQVAETVQQGVVTESLNAAGYSFIRVDRNGSSIWLAAPETNIEVGQNISWAGGAPMRNFTSRSLDRTFDEILFVNGVHNS